MRRNGEVGAVAAVAANPLSLQWFASSRTIKTPAPAAADSLARPIRARFVEAACIPDGGATPTIATPNFLDHANFHEYNFANISEQSREDGNASNTSETWLRPCARHRRLVRARARHGQDRDDQRSLRPIRRCRHPARQRREDLHEAAWRHRRRQEDRDHPP